MSLTVTHFSTSDSDGGSGRAAYRIHTGVRDLGLRSRMLVGHRGTDDPDVALISGTGAARVADRAADRITRQLGLQYLYLPSAHRLSSHPWVRESHVIQLFNLHGGYFSHTALPALSRQAPLVWRLSDMWAMTGHCAYPGTCERWQIGCGRCPDLQSYPEVPFDTTAGLWSRKRSLYQRSDITVVAPSTWMADQARRSPLLGGFDVRHIPNGLDRKVFRRSEQREARRLIGLPQDAHVILFVAHVLDDNPRKGVPALLEALKRLVASQQLGDRPLVLAVAGRGGESWEASASVPVARLGFLGTDEQLAAAYSSADVLAAPSVLENLPNTVLEAMACGTPAVAFDAGGMADAVRHLETGYLARAGDVEDLAAGLARLLSDRELRGRCGEAGQALIAQEFDQHVQARRFADLYQVLAARRRETSDGAGLHLRASDGRAARGTPSEA